MPWHQPQPPGLPVGFPLARKVVVILTEPLSPTEAKREHADLGLDFPLLSTRVDLLNTSSLRSRALRVEWTQGPPSRFTTSRTKRSIPSVIVSLRPVTHVRTTSGSGIARRGPSERSLSGDSSTVARSTTRFPFFRPRAPSPSTPCRWPGVHTFSSTRSGVRGPALPAAEMWDAR